jgi:hypothetical protein
MEEYVLPALSHGVSIVAIENTSGASCVWVAVLDVNVDRIWSSASLARVTSAGHVANTGAGAVVTHDGIATVYTISY